MRIDEHRNVIVQIGIGFEGVSEIVILLGPRFLTEAGRAGEARQYQSPVEFHRHFLLAAAQAARPRKPMSEAITIV